MSQSKILNLIEPTLFDQTGHSYTYVQCLAQANKDFNFAIQVWLDRRAGNLLDNTACTAHRYFYRPLRQLQKIFLYYKLLQKPEIIFVGTTELWDLKIFAFWAKLLKNKIKATVFLHFHQFKPKQSKLASLAKIAKQKLNFNILTPTEKLAKIFRDSGFENCRVVPCPTYRPAPATQTSIGKFTKVLYAGAARSDKGFPQVIELLAYNRAQNLNTQFEIQISAPNSQRYDSDTELALAQLKTLKHDNLTLHRDTLNEAQYLNLFPGAICLLVYKQQEYHDKFSAVALDAFYAGSPIITAKNTWMGDMAEKYQAGIALEDYTPAAIQAAIDLIASDYATYCANAQRAAQDLGALHDPRRTLELLY